MIAAYPDRNGFVGERRLSDNAEDVIDSARAIRVRLENALRLVEDLIDVADAKAEAADSDPVGYRRSHVKAMDAAEVQSIAVEDALATLATMLRSA